LAKTSVQAPATDRVASAIRRLEIEKHVGASQTWSVAAKHGPWQTTQALWQTTQTLWRMTQTLTRMNEVVRLGNDVTQF